MTKKEYILIFLDKVKDIREPARWFSVLMRYNVLNEEQVDELFSVFKNVVKTTVDEQKKMKIQKAIYAVEGIRDREKTNEVMLDIDQILNEN